MLRTNSKKARENVRRYIMDHVSVDCYSDLKQPETFEQTAQLVYRIFRTEYYNENTRKYHGYNEQKAFEYWLSGLPSIIDSCYYYNRSAVDDLAEILEENETEKSKYSEQQAEYVLSWLIYREIMRVIERG